MSDAWRTDVGDFRYSFDRSTGDKTVLIEMDMRTSTIVNTWECVSLTPAPKASEFPEVEYLAFLDTTEMLHLKNYEFLNTNHILKIMSILARWAWSRASRGPEGSGERQNWDEHHGCFTGDCPHDNVNDCITSLREAATEAGKERTARPMGALVIETKNHSRVLSFVCSSCQTETEVENMEVRHARPMGPVVEASHEVFGMFNKIFGEYPTREFKGPDAITLNGALVNLYEAVTAYEATVKGIT